MADAQPPLGHWANPAVGREYDELSAALRNEAWPDVVEHDIETAFGRTHVFEWPGAGEPIVFLHGAGSSSLMWAPILELLPNRHVYAIDRVGEPGCSEQTAPMTGVNDLVEWLGAVLDALELTTVDLVGASYGGWLACNFTMQHSEHVRTLTLVEPALTKISPSFWVHGAAVGIALMLPRAAQRSALKRLHMSAVADVDPRAKRIGQMGLTKYRRGAPRRVTPLSDDELRAITVPTLIVLGAHSEIHHASELLDRMLRVMPDARGELVPDAGHAVPLERPDAVARAFAAFV
jgi:pimeloyl-ACP methyl ester carboxylesterase